jgi:hypothetical protein
LTRFSSDLSLTLLCLPWSVCRERSSAIQLNISHAGSKRGQPVAALPFFLAVVSPFYSLLLVVAMMRVTTFACTPLICHHLLAVFSEQQTACETPTPSSSAHYVDPLFSSTCFLPVRITLLLSPPCHPLHLHPSSIASAASLRSAEDEQRRPSQAHCSRMKAVRALTLYAGVEWVLCTMFSLSKHLCKLFGTRNRRTKFTKGPERTSEKTKKKRKQCLFGRVVKAID